MEMLGRYERTTVISNKDAGSCRWCFATRNGQSYFIKEFLEPKYPNADDGTNPARMQKKLQKCYQFEQKKTRVYRTINENSDGNAVRVVDFFRVGAKYYMVMPRIQALDVEPEQMAALPDSIRRSICGVIAHALACLHKGRFVHSDIKHSNIMIIYSRSGELTAKLIDYDAGYFEDDPPSHPEEIVGDQVYFAPEACLAMEGQPAVLSCKLDIFSLGVLLHQYFTGQLPGFDTEQFSCAGEALAFGGQVTVSAALPEDLAPVISKMLSADPAARPTAWDVYLALSAATRSADAPIPEAPTEATEAEMPAPVTVAVPETPFVGDVPAGSGWQGLGDL